MDNLRRALNMAGLAKKAGRLAVGDEQTKLAIISGKARLLLIAMDSSESTKKKFEGMAAAAQTEKLILPCSKTELGGSIGRDTCAVAAVCDIGMAKAIIRLFCDPTDV